MCFCASLHHCKPLVLRAFDASMSLSALVMWPAHLRGSVFLCLGPFRTCSLSCVLFCVCLSTNLLDLFPLLSSILQCLQPFSLSMMSVVLEHFFCWVPCQCTPRRIGPYSFCQRLHPLVEGGFSLKRMFGVFFVVARGHGGPLRFMTRPLAR